MRKFFSTIWQGLTWPFRWIAGLFKRFIMWTPLGDFLVEDPEDVPILDTLNKATEDPSGFFESLINHLDALRKNLLHSVIALLAATIVSFYFVADLLEYLTEPVGGIESLQAIEVTEPIGVVMRVSLMAGFTLALPYITFEILRFIAPGISRRARLIGLIGIPLVFIFFIAGMAFSFYYIIPAALPVLLSFMGIPTLPRPASYLKFVTGILFWIGIAFELPLVTFLLSAMGILPARVLREQWRVVIIVLTIFAAMITPTVDPVNMMIVLLPLILLYFLSIVTASIGQGLKRNS